MHPPLTAPPSQHHSHRDHRLRCVLWHRDTQLGPTLAPALLVKVIAGVQADAEVVEEQQALALRGWGRHRVGQGEGNRARVCERLNDVAAWYQLKWSKGMRQTGAAWGTCDASSRHPRCRPPHLPHGHPTSPSSPTSHHRHPPHLQARVLPAPRHSAGCGGVHVHAKVGPPRREATGEATLCGGERCSIVSLCSA